MRCRLLTSASRGTLSRISVSSVSRPAIINGSAAFFAPEIGIVPRSLLPPKMRMRSIQGPGFCYAQSIEPIRPGWQKPANLRLFDGFWGNSGSLGGHSRTSGPSSAADGCNAFGTGGARGIGLLTTPAFAADGVLLHAASSLRGALTEVSQNLKNLLSSGYRAAQERAGGADARNKLCAPPGRAAPDREHALDLRINKASRSTPCPTMPVAPNRIIFMP